jgi:hypothetical protein
VLGLGSRIKGSLLSNVVLKREVGVTLLMFNFLCKWTTSIACSTRIILPTKTKFQIPILAMSCLESGHM